MISINQSAFIAGRQILDGFMIANEVVHSIRSKKDHGFLLKVDFYKAFNSILPWVIWVLDLTGGN